MAEEVCFLCRAGAQIEKQFDRESRSLLTKVECPRCGGYCLTPHAWTSHERAALAAYVRHENEVGRRPPLIQATNWTTLAKLGAAILQRR
jgi:hypothetical protein